jgi:mannonate dehydratase
VGSQAGWGRAGDPNKLWSYEELAALKEMINARGLELHAIENLDPAHWHDVLLDGPKKPQHLENVKTIIRNMGRAGIPVLGYNFSLPGVAARIRRRQGRVSPQPLKPRPSKPKGLFSIVLPAYAFGED